MCNRVELFCQMLCIVNTDSLFQELPQQQKLCRKFTSWINIELTGKTTVCTCACMCAVFVGIKYCTMSNGGNKMYIVIVVKGL